MVDTRRTYEIMSLNPPQRFVPHRFSQDIRQEIGALVTDDWHGIAYLAKEAAVIGIFAALPLLVSWWLTPISAVFIAAHQRGVGTIMHDAAHSVLARNKLLNDSLGFISAWMIFQLLTVYRDSHVRFHHRYLGRLDRDPDLSFFVHEDVFRPMPDRAFYRKTVLFPLLGGRNWSYLRYLVNNRAAVVRRALTPALPTCSAEWRRVRLELLGFLVFWLAVFAVAILFEFLAMLFLFWFVPFVTALPVIGWFIELSEHATSTERRAINVHMTRNRQSRHIEKWLFGVNNDHYHLDHHLDPRTPFWLLPKAHQVRMKDMVYRRHCEETGGLFQSGLDGSPSIMRLLLKQNRDRLEWAKHQETEHRYAS